MASEELLFGLMAAGAILALIGFVWLIIRAWKVHWAWGLGSLVLMPVAIVFVLLHLRRSVAPVLLMLLGGGLCVAPTVYNLVRGPQVQTTAEIETKGNEERITLTGATRDEYEKLRGGSFAVVQWANADVTDDDAELLRGMAALREVDLNATQITDRTLQLLAELPNLEVVRVANTQASAEGVITHLLPLPKLRELDVRGLKVPRAILQQWKGDDKSKRYAN
jgi:hypothetical protein